MMSIPARQALDHLSYLFAALRPELEEVLRRYQIPSEDAGGLLEGAVIELIYKGGEIEDPKRWLVARLRRSCRQFWIARRRCIAQAVSRVFAVR